MMRAIVVALLAWALVLPAAVEVRAQPTQQQPGQGQLVRIATETLDPDQVTAIFDGLTTAGRVRGLRVIPRDGGVIVVRIVVHYANGQIHYEDREIVMGADEQSKLIDPRFEERRVDRVEVKFKPGRRSNALQFELWAAQSDEALAEVRTSFSKKRGARTRTIENPKPELQPRTGEAPTAPGGPSATASDAANYTGVAVYYDTDRRKEDDRKMADGRFLAAYSGEPGRRLDLGRAVVTVPRQRKPGSIPLPEVDLIIRRVSFGVEDRAKHFTLASIDRMEPAAFVAAAKAQLGTAARFKGQAFVFVHGFNVSFDDALFRAAQISYDMGFDGLPLIYSWPSIGRAEAYGADRDRALDAADWLLQLFDIVEKQIGAKDIHVIAHSTGGFMLAKAMKQIARATAAGAPPRLGHLIFAAPDMIREDFAADAQQFKSAARSMTLYAS